MPALTPCHRHVVWGAGSLLTVQVSRQGLLTPAGVCGTCGTENRIFLGPHGDLGESSPSASLSGSSNFEQFPVHTSHPSLLHMLPLSL